MLLKILHLVSLINRRALADQPLHHESVLSINPLRFFLLMSVVHRHLARHDNWFELLGTQIVPLIFDGHQSVEQELVLFRDCKFLFKVDDRVHFHFVHDEVFTALEMLFGRRVASLFFVILDVV
jgi:hypothetical protein